MGLPTLFSALCAVFSNSTLHDFSPSILYLPVFSLSFAPRIASSLRVFFFPTVSSAADKEVEDYYTRKRHLPDLAARSTLPLHVLKMSQEQVGTEVFRSIVHASKQGHVLSSFMYL